MQIITALIALLNAIPILDRWAKEFTLAYAKHKLEAGDVDFGKAMDKATTIQSVKDLQSTLGSKLD